MIRSRSQLRFVFALARKRKLMKETYLKPPIIIIQTKSMKGFVRNLTNKLLVQRSAFNARISVGIVG